jgi:hypothetical protein
VLDSVEKTYPGNGCTSAGGLEKHARRGSRACDVRFGSAMDKTIH